MGCLQSPGPTLPEVLIRTSGQITSPWLSRGTLPGLRARTPRASSKGSCAPSSSTKLLPRLTAPPLLGPMGVGPSPPPPLASKPLRPGAGDSGLLYVLTGARKPVLPKGMDQSWQHTRRGAGACSPPTGHRAWRAPGSSRLPAQWPCSPLPSPTAAGRRRGSAAPHTAQPPSGVCSRCAEDTPACSSQHPREPP